MNDSPRQKPESPAFVDDVDSMVEFTDSAAEGVAERSAGGPAGNAKPLLTDEVDNLQVFEDMPTLPVPEAMIPAFIDDVDDLVEFVDSSPEKPVEQ